MLHIIADIIVPDIWPCNVANKGTGELVSTHVYIDLNKIRRYP